MVINTGDSQGLPSGVIKHGWKIPEPNGGFIGKSLISMVHSPLPCLIAGRYWELVGNGGNGMIGPIVYSCLIGSSPPSKHL